MRAYTKPGMFGMLLLVGAGSVGTPALAGVRRHDVDDAVYQALASEPAFASVGFMFINAGSSTCSGTLISDRWVLTAAHCVDGNTTSVSFGTEAAFGFVDQIVIHPDWNPSDFTAGNDLALLRLSAPISNIPPALLLNGGSERGALGTGVGYGRGGTGLTGDIAGTDGVKRAGTNFIDAFGSDRGWQGDILLADFDNPLNPNDSTYGDPTPTATEWQVAPGDSGGPMFVQTAQGMAIAGVASFIFSVDGNPNADYGDFSAYTRVSSFIPWIRSVSGVPSPGVLGLLGLGGVAGVRRRR